MKGSGGEVLIIGGGPAGFALGDSLAREGVSVTLVTAEPEVAWPNRYGAWVDELVAAGLEDCVSQVWSETLVIAGDGAALPLGRAYARVDNARLARRLAHARLHVVAGAVTEAHARGVVLASGERLSAALVVDASGRGRFLGRRVGGTGAAQLAYGRELAGAAHPFGPSAMVLMDLRGAPGADPALPSFLYAMPLAQGGLFVEETVLATRAAVSSAELSARLDRRLAGLGVSGALVSEERVRIPLDDGLPALNQPILGYGAAAGLVHPATGYQLGSALRAAPVVARAVAAALAQGRDPAAAGWAALWDTRRRATRRFHRLGLDVLLGQDSATQAAFFAAFFSAPGGRWRAWLDAEASVAATVAAMSAVFFRGGAPVRAPIARAVARLGRSAPIPRFVPSAPSGGVC